MPSPSPEAEQAFPGRPKTQEVAVVAGILMVLIALFFPDVVFGGRTLSSASFQFGVMGDAPPLGFPDVGSTGERRLFLGGPDYNYYLPDPLASAVASEPNAEEISRAFRAGRLPLWSSNWGAGYPVLATWSVDVVSPIRFPIELVPTPLGWDIFLLARLLVAGMFTYLVARRLGLVHLAGLTAAVGFTFSGYMMLFINMPHVEFAMVLPVVLYATDLLIDRASPGRFAFMAVAFAVGILSDNPRTAVIVVMFTVAYAVFRVLSARRGTQRRRAAGAVGAALVIGVGLTAWAVVPFVDFSPPSSQPVLDMNGRPDEPEGTRFTPPRNLIEQVVPFLEGAPTFAFDGGHTGVDSYVGGALPFLAALGIVGRRHRAIGAFFAAVLVVAWMKLYGSVLVAWAGNLPILNQVRFDKYLPPVAILCIAMLSGVGIDRLIRDGWPRWQIGSVFAALALSIAVLLFLNGDTLSDLPSGHLALQLSIAGAAVGSVALVGLFVRRRRVAVAVVLLGVLAAELMAATLPVKADHLPPPVRRAYEATELPLVSRPPRHDPFTEPPFVSFLRNEPGVFRVFGLERVLYPNTAFAYDLDDIRLFAVVPIDRYWRYIKTFINPSLRARFTGAPFADSESLPPQVADNRMFDLLNVRYVLARRREGTEAVFDSEGFSVVHERAGIAVLRNEHALPRAFLVHDVMRSTGMADSIARMLSAEFDPSKSAVVEQLPPSETFPGGPAESSVTIAVHEDERVVIDVRTDAKGMLVLGDTYLEGWNARIDGSEASIYPTDLALRGVVVPRGYHRVEFTYQPAAFTVGVAITIGSLLCLLAYASVAILSRRRGRRAAPPTHRPDGSSHGSVVDAEWPPISRR